MRFASLGSGSRGNALVVEVDDTRVLLDCGFAAEETERRLRRLDLAPADLAAIVLTHEHGDHVGGAVAFARRFGVAIWMTYGTFRALDPGGGVRVQLFDSHEAFAIGSVQVAPFPVPHDAREPVQCVFSDGGRRLGVLTDIGAPTRHVEAMLSGCDALVLECNHDGGMLAEGPYPRSLKERIAGTFGHLGNDAAARLLGALDRARLRHVVAAHLSETNNRPALAQAALAAVLGCAPEWIGVADQSDGFGWRQL